MKDSDEVKLDEFIHGEQPMETARVNGVQYVREHDGTWRYAHNWIKVPGARDLTLTERFQPKFIVSGAEVERVVVSGVDIVQNPGLLEWCFREGTPIRGAEGDVVEVIVPIEVWKEHDRIPGEIVAPEHSDDPAKRELAEAEREYREADRMLELAAAQRADVLRRYSEEMTRQEARAITDLSVGRIQQLIRDEAENELDDLSRSLMELIVEFQPKSFNGLVDLFIERSLIVYPTALIRQRVKGLQHREMLGQTPKGIQLTPEGRDALMLAKARQAPDGGTD